MIMQRSTSALEVEVSLKSTCKCGQTQVQEILKAKETIIADFKTHAPASRKRSGGTRYMYHDIDKAVYEWYRLARERLVPVTGPMLQSESLLLAKELWT